MDDILRKLYRKAVMGDAEDQERFQSAYLRVYSSKVHFEQDTLIQNLKTHFGPHVYMANTQIPLRNKFFNWSKDPGWLVAMCPISIEFSQYHADPYAEPDPWLPGPGASDLFNVIFYYAFVGSAESFQVVEMASRYGLQTQTVHQAVVDIIKHTFPHKKHTHPRAS
jgi:hypothetical protein